MQRDDYCDGVEVFRVHFKQRRVPTVGTVLETWYKIVKKIIAWTDQAIWHPQVTGSQKEKKNSDITHAKYDRERILLPRAVF